MPNLFGCEAMCRGCNKYHNDEMNEVGVFVPDPNVEKGLKPIDEDEEPEDDTPEIREIFGQVMLPNESMSTTKSGQLARFMARAPTLQEEADHRHLVGQDTDYWNFKRFLGRIQDEEDDADWMAEAFTFWDKDRTGKVPRYAFVHVIQEFGEPLTDEEAEYIADHFTDGNDPLDYKDACRRILDSPNAEKDTLACFKERNGTELGPDVVPSDETARQEYGCERHTAKPKGHSDAKKGLKENEKYFKNMFTENTASSPSGRRKRVSKFEPQLQLAGLAPGSDDIAEMKQERGSFMSEGGLQELYRRLHKKTEAETVEDLMKYFLYYDSGETGKVNRNQVSWQLQAYGDAVTEEDAETILTYYYDDDKEIYYKDFCEKLLNTPGNAKSVPYPNIFFAE
eukprot:GHVU01118941.1.p2 GENE.GHVU01118941.1~~GHVU01118941.1.p2  ORF type:complete len:396 (-),score=87.82 GHVU01118941.1:705-1892(-)